ncbi:MAG: hypothetical protein RLZZ499_622 [Cyanobacteriota bacterium]|jgi:uncharacterized protein (DUF4415 family)
MKKEEHIASYTNEELDEMIARGDSRTDWQRVRCMSEEDIQQNADNDLESPLFPYDDDFWQDAKLISPKQKISIRLDQHIIDHFKKQGSGYQKRINQVLDAYVRSQNRADR